VDFSLYKFNTIDRRITRRMVLNKRNTREEYANFLRGNEKELEALYSDVLISVTSFFRDPEAFEMLKRKVFSKLLQHRRDEPLRAWVLGCSTGQEAYSIAMAFVECANQAAGGPKLQIFASDLNEANLEKARDGFYLKNVVQDVAPGRLRRFFVEETGGYRIAKPLREMCVFARQNLARDPPFSRMDLISCRNVLIYLESDLQKRALPIFHYALKPDGFLFLGASESIGSFANLFETTDKKHKIFSKKPVPTPMLRIAFARHKSESTRETPAAKLSAQVLHPELNAQREADRVTLNRYAPPSVLIDAELQILQFRGDTSAYLKPPVGAAILNIVKMARDELIQPLRAAINQAKKKNKVTRKENIRVNQNGRTRTVNIEIIPLKNLKERSYLVLFEEADKTGNAVLGAPSREQPSGTARAQPISNQEESRRITDLEHELAETRDFAQAHQEQHEAANEELQAQSEELQSANEELQSINEELETSKEELESTNEELITVNDEMSNRNVELNRLNSDLKNLHVNLNAAIILLGRDLTIRSFTPLAEKTFKFSTTDVGRFLGDIRHDLDCPNLEEFITKSIDTQSACEREVRDKEGRWFSVRVRPYMTLDNKIDGAVLMLVDIDALKRSEQEIEVARDYAEAILRSARDPVVILRPDLCVNTANEAFYKTFMAAPEQTVGRSIFELTDGAWRIPKLRALLEDILPRNSFFNDFEVSRDFPGIGHRIIVLDARPTRAKEGTQPLIVLGIEDVTELRASQTALQFAAIIQTTDDAVWTRNCDGIITSWNPGAERMFGFTAKEMVGANISAFIPPAHTDEWQFIQEKFSREERVTGFESERVRKDGSRRQVSLSLSPVRDRLGKLVGVAAIVRDITERKCYEQKLAEQARLLALTHDAIFVRDAQDHIIFWNQGAEELYGWSQDEALGRVARELLGTVFPQPLEEITAQLNAAGHWSGELIHTRRDGMHLNVISRWALDRDAESRPVGVLENNTDITQRKQAEEALRGVSDRLANQAAELEKAVAERTEKLREMVSELEGFSYSVAHDLRAPVRAMQSFSNILAEECGDQLSVKGKDYIRRITTSAERMDKLIQDVLNYSRIVRSPSPLVQVDMGKLISGILESYEYLQSPAAEILLEGHFPQVMANEALLTQCISNLLGNAVKFVVPGVTPRVRVWAEMRHSRVRLFFKDNGIGIEKEEHEKIFEIFQQLDKRYEGTGIGLAIVKKAIERMGGKVGLESEPGQGSAFWLELTPAATDNK
jgi:two-component system, chemotaxis family, CheB/CheR fusion protein